jgi:uncharacterized protein
MPDRIGRWWPLDAAGHILNDAHLDSMQPAFQRVVSAAVQAYIQHIEADLDSIYVTGSVARGLAIPGLSDLNMFAVTAADADPDLVLRDWLPEVETCLLDQFPDLADVQLEIWPYYYVFDDPSRFSIGGFILKTHSVCVWGSDLSTSLPDYQVTPAIANDDLVLLAADLAQARAALAEDPSPENTRYWCRIICKTLLWCAFGLVQMAEGQHTRDVDLGYAAFARHYPGHAREMRRVLDGVNQPLDDADTVLHLLDTTGAWLLARADTWLDQYNPERDLALRVDDIEEMD